MSSTLLVEDEDEDEDEDEGDVRRICFNRPEQPNGSRRLPRTGLRPSE